MAREKRGVAVRWSASCAIMAALLRKGVEIELGYVLTGATRREAAVHERKEIESLKIAQVALANRVYNGGSAVSSEFVVDSILRAS